MNLLTRRGTSITFEDLPSHSRVMSDQELEEIMGRGCNDSGEECKSDCDCCDNNKCQTIGISGGGYHIQLIKACG